MILTVCHERNSLQSFLVRDGGAECKESKEDGKKKEAKIKIRKKKERKKERKEVLLAAGGHAEG